MLHFAYVVHRSSPRIRRRSRVVATAWFYCGACLAELEVCCVDVHPPSKMCAAQHPGAHNLAFTALGLKGQARPQNASALRSSTLSGCASRDHALAQCPCCWLVGPMLSAGAGIASGRHRAGGGRNGYGLGLGGLVFLLGDRVFWQVWVRYACSDDGCSCARAACIASCVYCMEHSR